MMATAAAWALLRSGGASLSTLAQQLSEVSSSLALVQLPGYGRGLVAQQDIQHGAVVWREQPLLSSPPPSALSAACSQCLRPLTAAPGAAAGGGGKARFCSDNCQEDASAEWLRAWERCRLEELIAACRRAGEKFPLLAARLACIMMQRQGGPTIAAPRQNEPPGTASKGDAVEGLQHLCFANIPEIPPPWLELHGLLLAGLRQGAAETSSSGAGGDSPAWVDATFTPDWFSGVLARLHLNSFRVDTVPAMDPRDPGAMLRAAAAAVSGAAPLDQHQTGTAVFLLASMFNHSCEPNLAVAWPGNSAVVEMRAARDIGAGEQLTIAYLDETLPREQRQEALRFAYGFACGCPSCREQGP